MSDPNLTESRQEETLDENAATKKPQTPRARLLSVVGIGASAGGLAALRTFFSALPANTGMSFVVVMHLSPEHDSMLAEVLQPNTAMPVTQVNERVEIRPNHVYVIPPGKRLVVSAAHLDIIELDRQRGRRLQIDDFFRSLAQHHANGAAIILSGTGSDGSVGIKGIKEGGGLILAQDPTEAEYGDMPRSAIATGLVDIVAPAAELATQLVDAKRIGAILELPSDPSDLTKENEESVTQILAYLRVHMGHDFDGYKRNSLLRRIGRRMGLTQIQTLSAYLQRLRQDSEEAKALYRDLLIHVTEFFRNPEAWQILAEKVIPQIFEGKGHDDTVRAWTVGCATGEEPYGLAILLLEHAATLQHPPQIQIFASDLGESALSYARRGIYPEAIANQISEERLERFFVNENNHFRVRDEVRGRVLFTPHNLLQSPPFSHLDLILCRNLLIYLQPEVQERVFQIFHYALLPHGYLFLGSAETTGSGDGLFETFDHSARLYQRSEKPGSLPVLPTLPLLPRHVHRPAQPAALEDESTLSTSEVHHLMLEELTPPSLLVDEHYNLLYLSETAGLYLQPVGGAFSRNILRLVRSELQSELSLALHMAFEQDRATTSKPIPVGFTGVPRSVTLQVRPNPAQRRALVVFVEEKTAAAAEDSTPAHGPDTAREDAGRIEQLEMAQRHAQQRLQAMREAYESAVEELHAVNEEMQSTSEEYRATLEELETSKEELQSINEELQTVNMELKDKVAEVGNARDDLQNLLTATEIATLFLDRDLHVVRYTSPAANLFNLIPSDRGRPIANLKANLTYAELEVDARSVLNNLTPVSREIRSDDNRWFQVNVRPYRTQDNNIDGVVITFFDITANKENEVALRQAKEYAESIIDTIPDALIVLDTDLRVRTANDTFYQMFATQPDKTEGEMFYHLGNGQWDIPELRTLFEDVLPENNVFVGYEVAQEFEKIGWHTVLLNGRRLDHKQLILLVITDISARKVAEKALLQLNEELEERVEKRTAQVRSLVTELTMSEQAERRRISQLLHDDLQQRLYGVLYQIAILSNSLANEEKTLASIADMKEAVLIMVQMARSLSIDLSPPILHNEGLVEAINWLATEMQRQHGLTIQVEATDDVPMLSDDLRVLLFQILRELLFNVIKHAETSEATVVLGRLDPYIHLEVIDKGKGFDTGQVLLPRMRSYGLDHIRRRLDLMGGHMQIESTLGKGTRVAIDCPTFNAIS